VNWILERVILLIIYLFFGSLFIMLCDYLSVILVPLFLVLLDFRALFKFSDILCGWKGDPVRIDK
jgi:hypothetical protein